MSASIVRISDFGFGTAGIAALYLLKNKSAYQRGGVASSHDHNDATISIAAESRSHQHHIELFRQ
jgi:hypothetical protein